MRYRSKPSEIDAIQWTGDNAVEVQQFCGPNTGPLDPLLPMRFYVDVPSEGKLLAGKNGESGWVLVSKGHWVARSVEDPTDVWPLNPEQMASKYEPVDAE